MEAGEELVVYNRTAEKALPLGKKGAAVASDITEVADSSDIIILMLSDGPAIKDVLAPVLHGDTMRGKTIIQMGTILPEESLYLYYTMEQLGGNYLEAPVLGSIPNVRAKELIVLGGAMKKELFARYLPLLSAFGESIFFVGKIGQAAAIKLALNQMIASLTAAFSLSLGIVRQREIDVDLFMSILRKSALYAPTFDKKLNNMLNRSYQPTNFPLKHLLKDMRLVKQESLGDHLNTVLVDAVVDYLEESLRDGNAEADYSAIYQGVHREE